MVCNKQTDNGLPNLLNSYSHMVFTKAKQILPCLHLLLALSSQQFLCIVIFNNTSHITSLKQQLHKTFYLGIEFLRNSTDLIMNQRKFTLELLKLAGILHSKPAVTPLDPTIKLTRDSGDPLRDFTLYRTLVGKLIYLTITRLDLSFAVQALSQFSQQPTHLHMKALMRVLRYIKACPGQCLFSLL